ncbi:NAD(P)H-binding protein [Fructilactobacillus cliffordii]|uniref:NAD(P)-dependent oxidoreductase n=1 Tax=Fructilactobacillus cliffordii TaxID=2940299 RepID=UPI002093B86B|nr:NAD(P)H-binding protein [Fructilactobacillus cliffordii]USS87117.1 NAD(P)H-binding protein [Fructilactobacillus cliffordii]
MKIMIIGATGMTGKELVAAAIDNDLQVVANARNPQKLADLQTEFPGIEVLAKDAFALEPTDFNDVDVIIDAFATTPDQAYLHVDLATKLIAMFRNSEKRLGFILGAGSLYTDQSQQRLAYDDIKDDKTTKPWRAIPENQLYELEFLRNVKNVSWFGVSPGFNYVPGKKADHIIEGTDYLLFNDKHVSETTAQTMADSVIQEVLHPKHRQTRFTVING